MKKIYRFTESDLMEIIRKNVKKHIIRESLFGQDDMGLQLIAQKITDMAPIYYNDGENDIEVDLGDSMVAYVTFNVSSDPYVRPGMRSNDYDVPDDPDEVIDNFEVEVTGIYLDDETEVQDNGIVKKALENSLELDSAGMSIPSEEEYNYYEE